MIIVSINYMNMKDEIGLVTPPLKSYEIFPSTIVHTDQGPRVSMITKGFIEARVLPVRYFLLLLHYYIHICAIIMHYFHYTDKREVLQHDYSQHPILHSPHFRCVVNTNKSLEQGT